MLSLLKKVGSSVVKIGEQFVKNKLSDKPVKKSNKVDVATIHCGGWLPENIIKILFFKVVELENRIEQIEGAK